MAGEDRFKVSTLHPPNKGSLAGCEPVSNMKDRLHCYIHQTRAA